MNAETQNAPDPASKLGRTRGVAFGLWDLPLGAPNPSRYCMYGVLGPEETPKVKLVWVLMGNFQALLECQLGFALPVRIAPESPAGVP